MTELDPDWHEYGTPLPPDEGAIGRYRGLTLLWAVLAALFALPAIVFGGVAVITMIDPPPDSGGIIVVFGMLIGVPALLIALACSGGAVYCRTRWKRATGA